MEKKDKKTSLKDPLGLKKAERLLILPVILAPVIVISLVIAAFFFREKSTITRDLNPRQVVELFYTSVNTLDTSTMNQCIDTGRITPLNNRITANTLIGMYSHAMDFTHIHPYVGSDMIIYTPSEWLSKGQPSLEHGERVLGILNLEISEIKENQFKVTYDYYLTGLPEEGKAVKPFVYRYTDICTLEPRAGDWKIVIIEQVSEESIQL